jgi:hypothetical protein
VAQSPALLHESPTQESPKVASAVTGTVFHADSIFGDFYRIALTDSRRAWVAAKDVTIGGNPLPVYTPFMDTPPKIEIKNAAVQRRSDKSVTIKGSATHPSFVRDVIIFVGDKKVLYQPSVNNTESKRIDFSADVPLEEGANQIMIVARHNDKVMGMQTIFVRRDAAK